MKKLSLLISIIVLIIISYFTFSNLEIKSENRNRIKGIDISNKYKGNLKWSELKEFGDFVILRAVRAIDTCKTKGIEKFASIPDKKFNKNWKSLKNNKIIRGAYHFFAPNVSAKTQFDIFKRTVKLEKGDLPPILDVENRNCDMNEVFKWLELAKTHFKVKPILYSEYFFYKLFLKNKNNSFPIWLYINENFFMEPSFKNPNCVLWQYKQDKLINDFQEKVDFNVFLGKNEDFKNLLIK